MDVTVDDLIGMEMDVYDRAMKGVLARDEHGQPLLCDGEPLITPDLHSANHALENIARLCGFMIERREITIHAPTGMTETAKLEVIEGGKLDD